MLAGIYLTLLHLASPPCFASLSTPRRDLLADDKRPSSLWKHVSPLTTDQIELTETIQYLRERLPGDPDNVELRWWKGWCYRQLEEYDSAIPELEFVLHHDPEDAEARHLLGEVYNNKAYILYQQGGNPALALVLIEKAITLDPDEPLYLGTKGEVLYRLGRHREALKCIKRALRDYPDHPEMLEDLKRVKTAMGVRR